MCCGFGHRVVLHPLPLDLVLEQMIIQNHVTVFMTGGMGEFDMQFAKAVRKLKKYYPPIRLILVKPYFSHELNTNQCNYERLYDEIIIPAAVEGVHYKAAVEKRNRWMVEQSDFVISYLYRQYGGAYKAIRYAERYNKIVIPIRDE